MCVFHNFILEIFSGRDNETQRQIIIVLQVFYLLVPLILTAYANVLNKELGFLLVIGIPGDSIRTVSKFICLPHSPEIGVYVQLHSKSASYSQERNGYRIRLNSPVMCMKDGEQATLLQFKSWFSCPG